MAEKPKTRQLKNAAMQWGVEPDDLIKLLGLPVDTPYTEMVQMALVEQRVTESRQVTKQLPEGGKPAVAPSRRRRSQSAPSSGGAVVVSARTKTAVDDQWLDWLRAVVALDRKIRTGQLGSPFRPHFEQRGTKIAYEDPFRDLLRDGSRLIIVEFDTYTECTTEDRHLPWRSTELLRMVEEGLSSLWLAPTACKGCKGTMTGRLGFDFAKRVLKEDIVLPGARGGKRLANYYPKYHGWCQVITEQLVALEVELQDMQGDDPEAVARRSAKYVEILAAIKSRFEPEGLTLDELKSAFYTIIGRV